MTILANIPRAFRNVWLVSAYAPPPPNLSDNRSSFVANYKTRSDTVAFCVMRALPKSRWWNTT